MNPTRDEMKREALTRMKMLKMHTNPIQDFSLEDKLNLSEGGALFWLDREQQKMVDDWEAKTGNLVYHIIHDWFEFGEMLTFLYVSKYLDEWEIDRADITECSPVGYVMNLDYPDCSEYGHIGIRPFIGGVIRTW